MLKRTDHTVVSHLCSLVYVILQAQETDGGTCVLYKCHHIKATTIRRRFAVSAAIYRLSFLLLVPCWSMRYGDFIFRAGMYVKISRCLWIQPGPIFLSMRSFTGHLREWRKYLKSFNIFVYIEILPMTRYGSPSFCTSAHKRTSCTRLRLTLKSCQSRIIVILHCITAKRFKDLWRKYRDLAKLLAGWFVKFSSDIYNDVIHKYKWLLESKVPPQVVSDSLHELQIDFDDRLRWMESYTEEPKGCAKGIVRLVQQIRVGGPFNGT